MTVSETISERIRDMSVFANGRWDAFKKKPYPTVIMHTTAIGTKYTPEYLVQLQNAVRNQQYGALDYITDISKYSEHLFRDDYARSVVLLSPLAPLLANHDPGSLD